jgi:tetratricopeptide (TPR) repeat protein
MVLLLDRRPLPGMLAALFVAGSLAGCASAPSSTATPATSQVSPPVLETVRREAIPPQERLDPLHLSDEMRQWLRRSVPRQGMESERAAALVQRIQSHHRRGLVYDASFTGTAEDVFRDGRFNCLSFVHLFVAMARELGIDAYYLVLDRDWSFNRDGDLVVSTRHATAGVRSGSQQFTLELNVGPRVDHSKGRVIGDATAHALHYANRGAELLTRGEAQEALRHLATAVDLDPGLAQAWVNLGVGLRRLGRMSEAEQAYLQATAIDPGYQPAYSNLAALSTMRGDRDAARRLLDELDRRETRNPFVLLTLGDWSLSEGELRGAQRLYRRAYGLAREDAETRAALGQWAMAAGKRDEAVRWLERAREADPESPRVASLERQLGL